MNDLESLTAALTNHWWLGALGSFLLILVNTGRLPGARRLWEYLPAWTRPLVPILLACLTTLGHALATGAPWLPALVQGLVTGSFAALSAQPSQVVTRSVQEALTVPADLETVAPYTGPATITRKQP